MNLLKHIPKYKLVSLVNFDNPNLIIIISEIYFNW